MVPYRTEHQILPSDLKCKYNLIPSPHTVLQNIFRPIYNALKNVMWVSAEAQLSSPQASKMENFATIVNSF